MNAPGDVERVTDTLSALADTVKRIRRADAELRRLCADYRAMAATLPRSTLIEVGLPPTLQAAGETEEELRQGRRRPGRPRKKAPPPSPGGD